MNETESLRNMFIALKLLFVHQQFSTALAQTSPLSSRSIYPSALMVSLECLESKLHESKNFTPFVQAVSAFPRTVPGNKLPRVIQFIKDRFLTISQRHLELHINPGHDLISLICPSPDVACLRDWHHLFNFTS